MRKEITYKDLLIKILEGKEVPKEIIYNDKTYVFNSSMKEYVIYDCCVEEFLSDTFKYLTFEGIINEKVLYNVELLDNQEKAYLKAVIRPFRNRVAYIKLVRFVGSSFYDNHHILIKLKNGDWCSLPKFKLGTMYKNLEINKEYTLEELGL